MKREKRIFWSVVLNAIPFGAPKIADIIKKHNLYGSVGNRCAIQKRKIPLYSELIHLHDNICVGSNVEFVTHDAVHVMLNHKFHDNSFVEKIGCIEVMDNVFIGAGSIIMGNIRIGSNVIIGAGSLITKDIPDNSVVSGVPAKFICHFDDFVETRIDYSESFKSMYGIDRINGVDKILAEKLYQKFCEEKDIKKKN